MGVLWQMFLTPCISLLLKVVIVFFFCRQDFYISGTIYFGGYCINSLDVRCMLEIFPRGDFAPEAYPDFSLHGWLRSTPTSSTNPFSQNTSILTNWWKPKLVTFTIRPTYATLIGLISSPPPAGHSAKQASIRSRKVPGNSRINQVERFILRFFIPPPAICWARRKY